jgi:hypothetical protein
MRNTVILFRTKGGKDTNEEKHEPSSSPLLAFFAPLARSLSPPSVTRLKLMLQKTQHANPNQEKGSYKGDNPGHLV